MTWLPGQRITAARLNLPQFSGFASIAQSIPNITWTTLSLDSETTDTDLGHDLVTNNSRYTIMVAGTYLIIGTATFAASATGLRGSKILKNGSVIQGSGSHIAPGPTVGTTALCSTTVPLVVGDYIEVAAFQASGGALNTLISTDVCPTLVVQCVGQ